MDIGKLNPLRGPASDDRLTVVMPTRNHAPYIRRALDSLVAQTRRPDHILVIDDASTDGTPGILRVYAERYPFVSVVTHEQNRGTVPRMCEALTTVESEFVLFLSSDDFIDATLCAKSLDLLDRNPQSAFCAVQRVEVDEQGSYLSWHSASIGGSARFLEPPIVARMLIRHGNLFTGLGTIYRTALLRAAGGFDTGLQSFADGYVTELLGAKHGACVIPEYLVFWRGVDSSYSNTTARDPARVLTILEATLRRMAGPDRAFLSVEYRHRLEYRLRFVAAVAAVRNRPIDRRLLHCAIAGRGGPIVEWGVLLGSAISGTLGKLALFAVLRPSDLLPVTIHRFMAAVRGDRPAPIPSRDEPGRSSGRG
jgi:glycosyltransferase involved in cell wall biosynthesis